MREVALSLGIVDEEGKTFQQEFDEALSCSYQTRMIGFFAMFGLGWLSNAIGAGWLATGDMKMFAIYYCIGSLVSIGATCFLFGPCAQLKSMFDPVRAGATVVYLISIAATIIMAVEVGKFLPILFCLIIQFCAYVYYCFSYIPYGRACLRSSVTSLCRSSSS
jgi:hypothetical protein